MANGDGGHEGPTRVTQKTSILDPSQTAGPPRRGPSALHTRTETDVAIVAPGRATYKQVILSKKRFSHAPRLLPAAWAVMFDTRAARCKHRLTSDTASRYG